MSDRKYRQSGYQDGGERRGSRGPSGPRPKKDGPRGRGLGAPTATVFRCAVCGAKQSAPEDRGASCSKCGTDIHTCTHCVSFDSSARFQCRQPIEKPVSGKAKANDCSLFQPKQAQEFDREGETPDDVRAAFDALFDL